ncbi:helix-turn-helix domain-containing protein [Hyunsoonleella sp. 2307UL5-6]|uniref:helix-turn-helix domain-containing protein n=1 Tax=Hyunsoonleella sp. 2307UL5-6 TaxID=3384768 RepID=UPI0039BD57EF
MTEIGKRIKEIRLKKGLSQEELAEASKVNLRTIQRIENNETKPREKTLQLIFNALEIEIIEREKKRIDKYLIWSTFLTLLIIIGSFIGWFQIKSEYGIDFEKTGPVLITPTGWVGNISFNGINLYNWLVSITALSIGIIAIAYSLGLIKNKIRFILGQLIFISFYLISIIYLSIEFSKYSKYFRFKPGLFIVAAATILITILYIKKEKKGANTVYN